MGLLIDVGDFYNRRALHNRMQRSLFYNCISFMLRLRHFVFLCFLICMLPFTAAAQDNGMPVSYKLAAMAQAHQGDAHALPLYALQPVQPIPHDHIQQGASAIEDSYNERITENLLQYGYGLLTPDQGAIPADNTQTPSARLPAGSITPSYILGQGDMLDITLTGANFLRQTYTIDEQGRLHIQGYPPITAAGRSLQDVRADIQNLAKNTDNQQAHIALAQARQIDVLIAGHARKPGKKTFSIFHSVIDALIEAGGIEKTGSLRQIKVIRSGHSQTIDLYDLLIHARNDGDLALQDGDKIIIPPIGPTIAIAGNVKRPGIYELLPAQPSLYSDSHGNAAYNIDLNTALTFAGGTLPGGEIRFLRLSVDRDGQEMIDEIQDPYAPMFGNGAILMTSKAKSKRRGEVALLGHTTTPGLHSLKQNPSLATLLSNDSVLGDDIYPLIGVIQRYDPKVMAHRYLDFPVRQTIQGAYDQKLYDGDQITLFSNADIAALSIDNEANQPPTAQDERPSLDQGLTDFLKERSIFVRGAVRNPGSYPISQTTTLDIALASAGGPTLEAARNAVEITSLFGPDNIKHTQRTRYYTDMDVEPAANIALSAGDTVRINQQFHKIKDQSVLISGEVKRPGRYDLIAGDTILSLIQRAGGLTQQAYPAGAIFSRASERLAEENRYKNKARMIRQALASAMQSSDKDHADINPTQIAEARALAAELESAQGIGRITVEANPTILEHDTRLDMLLESGDRLYIPKRNLTVRVSGEVLSPAALQFRDGKDPAAYIQEAGGFTFHADSKRSFVLYPDGSAQPLRVSSWNYSSTIIPPGSTIIVPRDPKPFDFVSSFKDVTQILSNLAVTAIFIDDVRDD